MEIEQRAIMVIVDGFATGYSEISSLNKFLQEGWKVVNTTPMGMSSVKQNLCLVIVEREKQ